VVIRGILTAGQKLKSFNDCVQELLKAANYQGASVTNLKNETGKLAFDDEKQKYYEYILSISESNLASTELERPIYRKKLNEYEAKKIRKKLLINWNYNGCYWCPLADVAPVCALFLMDEYVLPFEENIIDIIKSISLNKFYAIDEMGDDYKHSIDTFNLSSLYETICCDDTFEWVVYRSHESTISFGGEKLIPKIKELLKRYEDKFNVMEFE
jgi:hypothetical protein